ncbi:sulfite oxidase isoform X2 [Beta vulgaris subsp. vulgaris]|uniref:sulfite oxidase isoform X2 n=1 Tax=Beta vulgaris subsp. vulgaris TaxID=3555 RepID=UPI0020369D4D|nr:sulfite oxidase isoform X2 [Beta vulgaris subsp. vulgaris]
MPGIRSPSDYSNEPPRHPSLKINSKEPFNAEPHRSGLISSYVTPVDLFYKRNHGPIPVVDDIERYRLSVMGLINIQRELSMKDIWDLPKHTVTATLQCAGNRRTAMSKTRKVRGVGWDISAIGNAVWAGAKLADVLELVGIPKLSNSTPSGGKHVEFVSIDRCKEENGGPYKASIPLIQATNPEADVLLAYEMNGEPLNRDHGYPLRVVVPGVIGARSVKWLDSMSVIAEECQSAICSLEDSNVLKDRKVTVKGYAVSGGGRGIERVDISIDGGKTWVEASRYQKPGVPYVADGPYSEKWAWVFFEAKVEVSHSAEIVAKAVDIAANVQPENVESIWNLRGILNTSWHRVDVRVGHSSM